MLYLGCDPDLHNCSFALVDKNKKILDIQVCKVSQRITGIEAVQESIIKIKKLIESDYSSKHILTCVEGQQIYTTGTHRTKNSESILYISLITGAVLGLVSGKTMCPKPREWKSQLKKYIHHQRIYKELKIPYRLSESNNGNIVIIPEIKNVAVKKTEIIHISDAIGLALYAIKKNR